MEIIRKQIICFAQKRMLILEEENKVRTSRPGNVYKLSIYGSVCVPTDESLRKGVGLGI